MPKTRLQSTVNKIKRTPVPPPNYVEELMRRYRRAQKISSDDIGASLGITGAAVRYALNRPASAWKLEELQRYCAVLNIPLEDALNAAEKSMEVLR